VQKHSVGGGGCLHPALCLGELAIRLCSRDTWRAVQLLLHNQPRKVEARNSQRTWHQAAKHTSRDVLAHVITELSQSLATHKHSMESWGTRQP
jgi:hypothetical protein